MANDDWQITNDKSFPDGGAQGQSHKNLSFVIFHLSSAICFAPFYPTQAMNIRQQLLKRNSRANADIVIAHVASTPKAIVELMACFLSDEVTVAQRAAQVVGDIGRKNPEMLEPWWSEMVEAAKKPVHDAIQRNVCRYFSELDLTLPTKLETSLITLLTDWTCEPTTPVAIQVYAMQFVADRAERFPNEAERVKAAILSQFDTATAGFRSRGKRVLKQLEH